MTVGEESLKYHYEVKGKIEITPRMPAKCARWQKRERKHCAVPLLRQRKPEPADRQGKRIQYQRQRLRSRCSMK